MGVFMLIATWLFIFSLAALISFHGIFHHLEMPYSATFHEDGLNRPQEKNSQGGFFIYYVHTLHYVHTLRT
jgi:hypothetical protein